MAHAQNRWLGVLLSTFLIAGCFNVGPWCFDDYTCTPSPPAHTGPAVPMPLSATTQFAVARYQYSATGTEPAHVYLDIDGGGVCPSVNATVTADGVLLDQLSAGEYSYGCSSLSAFCSCVSPIWLLPVDFADAGTVHLVVSDGTGADAGGFEMDVPGFNLFRTVSIVAPWVPLAGAGDDVQLQWNPASDLVQLDGLVLDYGNMHCGWVNVADPNAPVAVRDAGIEFRMWNAGVATAGPGAGWMHTEGTAVVPPSRCTAPSCRATVSVVFNTPLELY